MEEHYTLHRITPECYSSFSRRNVMDFNQLLQLLRALDEHTVDYVTVRPQDKADTEALREAFPREVE
jgi:hypothetical protein